MFGPTGIGVLYGKLEILEEMPAWQVGGNMIHDVTFDKTVYHKAPTKFKALQCALADILRSLSRRFGLESTGVHP